MFDVPGAGDTRIAVFTPALRAGAASPEAGEPANPASVVVRTLGIEELLGAFE